MMKTTYGRMTISVAQLLLAASMGSMALQAQTGAVALTDAQAQQLMTRMQTQPNVPLSQAEGQNLSRYLMARNAPTAAAAGTGSASPQTGPAGTQAGAATAPAAPGPGAANPGGAMEAKKPGVVRVGVVQTKADFGQGQGPSAGESVRLLMEQYLGGPKLQAVSLSALLPQQAEAEAKERECDYILYSSLTQKKSAGGGMGFLKGGSSMLSMIPMVGMASGISGAIAATSVASAAATSASLAGQVKAKSDVTFEYTLQAPGSATPVLTNKTTAHAKTDGEDLVTPLIVAAATTMVDKVSAPR